MAPGNALHGHCRGLSRRGGFEPSGSSEGKRRGRSAQCTGNQPAIESPAVADWQFCAVVDTPVGPTSPVAHRGLRGTGQLAMAGPVWPGQITGPLAQNRNHAGADWRLCGYGTRALYGRHGCILLCACRRPEMAGKPVSAGFLCAVFYSRLPCHGQLPVSSGDSLDSGELHRYCVAFRGIAGSQCTGAARRNDIRMAEAGRLVPEDFTCCGSAVCVLPPDVTVVERPPGFG